MLNHDFRLHLYQSDVDSLFYVDEGQGEPIVFIHGSLCDYRFWHPQITAIAQHYRVIVPSLRHYFPSTQAQGAFSIQQHAQDVIRLLDHLELPRAHIVGHSRGGVVAIDAALRFPEYCQSLCLAEPGLHFETGYQHWQQQAWKEVDHGDIDSGLEIFVDRVTGPGSWKRMVSWFKTMTRDNAMTLQYQHNEPFINITPELIRTIKTPTLLIGGNLSPSNFGSTLDTLKRLIPRSEYLIIGQASHGMNLSAPSLFNRIILSFITVHANKRQSHV